MLVLASASPRRRELLRNAGIDFISHPVSIPEVPQPGEKPHALAERLAREKALAAAEQLPGNFILGADTVVVVDGQILGKPQDEADAGRMLRLLAGRSHQVITGVCLVGLENQKGDVFPPDVRSQTTLVTLDALTEAEIRSYVSTGEPMDKAGAYAIQGMASRWIPRIEGDYFNVVGLPVSLVWRMLREHAYERSVQEP
ncbi:MAG TPA: Maf family protein [Terriglobales bacterium]|nr:Maf family protein [Terriglobales bacterium]